MACAQVGHVQRRFVVRLLGQSSFSKHLAAVRATNTLLKRAVELRSVDNGHSIKARRTCLSVQSGTAVAWTQTASVVLMAL